MQGVTGNVDTKPIINGDPVAPDKLSGSFLGMPVAPLQNDVKKQEQPTDGNASQEIRAWIEYGDAPLEDKIGLAVQSVDSEELCRLLTEAPHPLKSLKKALYRESRESHELVVFGMFTQEFFQKLLNQCHLKSADRSTLSELLLMFLLSDAAGEPENQGFGEKFLMAGADPNISYHVTSQQGVTSKKTPLMLAVDMEAPTLVKALVEHNADISEALNYFASINDDSSTDMLLDEVTNPFEFLDIWQKKDHQYLKRKIIGKPAYFLASEKFRALDFSTRVDFLEDCIEAMFPPIVVLLTPYVYRATDVPYKVEI